MKTKKHSIYLLIITLFGLVACGDKDLIVLKNPPPTHQDKDQEKLIPYDLQVYMSPHQGKAAFKHIYKIVENAEDFVHMSLYSWSDKGLYNSLLHTLNKEHPPKVKIILHRPLRKKLVNTNSSFFKKVKTLEEAGAIFKLARKKMHEKFLIIDDTELMNSSANMSSGPLSRYSENFIFYKRSYIDDVLIKNLIDQFKHEFSILFNSGSDILTHDEKTSDELHDYLRKDNAGQIVNEQNSADNLFLVSSSMNYHINNRAIDSEKSNNGQFLTLKLKKIKNKKVWRVRSEIISHINNATESILVCLNHLTLPKVKDAIMKAVKRGVDVKWVVDNHEYRYLLPNKKEYKTKEQTPFFVKEYKEYFNTTYAPVRVKWYSLAPNPRYALLNHHKYILIDYGTTKPVLLSGSSNISKTAEFSQFDNMVIHKSKRFKKLFASFYNEFYNLWFFNRNKEDNPKEKLITKISAKRNNEYIALHQRFPISLKWEEVTRLRKTIFAMAPTLSRKLSKNNHCGYYKPLDQLFYNFNAKKMAYTLCKKRF